MITSEIVIIRTKTERKIIRFNPPFCKSTIVNIGKNFLNLIDEYFPKNNILSRIFNRNT